MKRTYLILALLLLAGNAFAQLSPRFVYQKGTKAINTCYLYSSYELTTIIKGVYYNTYVEKSLNSHGTHTIKAPGKPAYTRKLTKDEVSNMPRLYTIQRLIKHRNAGTQWKFRFIGGKDKYSFVYTSDGLLQRKGNDPKENIKKYTVITCKLKNSTAFPPGKFNAGELRQSVKKWNIQKAAWNNGYTYTLHQDSTGIKDLKAYRITKIITVKKGRVTKVQAVMKVKKNRNDKEVFKTRRLKISRRERKKTGTLDDFYALIAKVAAKNRDAYGRFDNKGIISKFTSHGEDSHRYKIEKVLPN